MTAPTMTAPTIEATSDETFIVRGFTSDDLSRLAYACSVLEAHASSDDYRAWAARTAKAIRKEQWRAADERDD